MLCWGKKLQEELSSFEPACAIFSGVGCAFFVCVFVLGCCSNIMCLVCACCARQASQLCTEAGFWGEKEA